MRVIRSVEYLLAFMKRRKILIVLMSLLLVIGLSAAALPFISSLRPTGKQRALDDIVINLRELK